MSTPHHDPEENLPDWLKALRRKQSEQEPSEPQPAQEPASPAEEPDWLKEIRQRHQTDAGDGEPERALTDTQPNKPFRLEKRRIGAEPREEQPEPEGSDWLEGMRAEVAPFTNGEEDASTPVTPAFTEQPEISPGELPSWLQALRPGEAAPPSEDLRADEMLPAPQIENAGPLAGLSGVLPAEPEVAKIGKSPVFSTRLEVTEAQHRHAAALRDLIAIEAAPKEDHASSVRKPARLLNLGMSAALLLAALAPLITGSFNAARPEVEVFPEGAAMFNIIEVLPAGAPVLVVFDVQPALYGEVKAPAAAVLAHLLERQARLVFISTQPTGPALAERLLQEELAAEPLVASGDYVSLGYLPGGMAAVRSFASDPRRATLSAPATVTAPWLRPGLQAVNSLGDFALVLLVVSEGEDGRTWVEQASPSLAEGMLALSSAQAAPVLRAYLHTQPALLRGLVAGIGGAAHYERLRTRDGQSRVYWDSYSYQLGATVLIILLGGLYGRVILTRPEKATVKA